MTNLEQSMTDLVAVQEVLYGWLEAEAESLKLKNYRELSHIASQKLACLQQVQAAVHARDTELQALLPGVVPVSFEALSSIVQPEDLERLNLYRERSRHLGEASAKLNDINTATMRLMSHFVSGMLTALTPNGTTVRTYGRAGLNDTRIGTSRSLGSA